MNTNTTLSKGSWIQLNERRAARMVMLLLLLALPAAVQAQFTFTTNNGAITITKYTGPGGAVTIPSTTNGLPVTTIGQSAFASCYALTSVTIPNSVTVLRPPVFPFCTGLTGITVDPLNSVYSSVDGVLFDKGQTTLLEYPGARTGAYTIPNSVTSIWDYAFSYCGGLTSVTIPDSVTHIGYDAFWTCLSLTSVTIPNGVIGSLAFDFCPNLTSVTIGKGVTSIAFDAFIDCPSLTAITVDALNSVYSSLDGVLFDKSQTTLLACPKGKAGAYAISNSVTSIGYRAFNACANLSSVTIGNGVTSIGNSTFGYCTGLMTVTIGIGVTSIDDYAFLNCTSLTVVQFNGNAPSFGPNGSTVFSGDTRATIYCLPGTSGWGATFGGRPVVRLQGIPPTIQTPPRTQTAEAGSAAGLWVKASGSSPLFCVWYLNATNLLSCSTNGELNLTNVQLSQSGAYTVVVTNAAGAVTSAPAMLNVIAAVEHRPVPGVKVTSETGSLLNVDYANSLSPAPNWTTLGSVSLTGTSQYYFDLTLPLPPQRFYRAWQTGTPGVVPSLGLHMVPAITLTSNVGDSVRLDYINQFGPIDDWVTLDTVTLTNTSQLYFDISAPGQPQRLYRLAPSP